MEEPEQFTVSHQYSYGGESKEAPLVRGTATGRGPTEEVARLAATEDLYRQLTAQHDEAAARFARDGLFNDADALTRAGQSNLAAPTPPSAHPATAEVAAATANEFRGGQAAMKSGRSQSPDCRAPRSAHCFSRS